MISYLVRHGRTELSARYLVNGDPTRPVALDATGRGQAREFSGAPWLGTLSSCLVSEFPRTQETARLILGDTGPALTVDPLLNEIDYGTYEGGPWTEYGDWLREAGVTATPAGARESWQAACARMLRGLAGALAVPGPRLVVGHGLMISLVTHLLTGDPLHDAALPDAPYVQPLILTDGELARVVTAGQAAILTTAPSR